MCSIWGVGLLNGSTFTDSDRLKLLLKQLAEAGQVRGMITTGLAIAWQKEIAVLKTKLSGKEFGKTKKFNEVCDKYCNMSDPNNAPISIIGHNRMPTQGSENNNDNNHPIVAQDVIGVHNGSISNNHRLFETTKDVRRQGEVDSEIIFRLFDKYVNKDGMEPRTALSLLSNVLQGGFAFAMLNRKAPYMLYLVRGNQPIHIRSYTEIGIKVFASTEAICRQGVARLDLGEFKSEEVLPWKAMTFNLYTNQSNSINLARG